MASRELFDRLYKRYDEWYEKNRIVAESEASLVEHMVRGAPRPILDLGVGTGFFALRVKAEIGLDPSIGMLSIAKTRGVDLLIAGVGEYLPFRNSSIGTVLLVVTLCFVDDPEAVIRESRRVLINYGHLVPCIVPRESKWGRHYEELGGKGHPFYSIANFLTIKDVRDMMTSLGFTIVDMKGVISYGPTETPKFEEPSGDVEDKGFVCIKGVKKPV